MITDGSAGRVNRQITLASRPKGLPAVSNFKMVESPIPSLAVGDVLVRTTFVSVDPYLRPAMNNSALLPTGACVPADAVGRVVTSRHALFRPGEFVQGMFGWQDYAAAPWYVLRKLDPRHAPVSTALGILGASGLTAYFGLFETARAVAAETVVVSAAAGAVGSAAAQLAKLAGCRVIGLAGSDDKVRYLIDELGLDAAFNYKGEHEWQPQLGAVSPFGIDVYFDNVGGRVSDIIFPYLNTGARVAVCGQISEYNRESPSAGPRWLNVILEKRAKVQGFMVTDFAARYAEALHNLSTWLRAGWLTYRETIEDGLENAPRAFIGMLEGKNIGKQLVKVE
jgi:NADPH-dependent curcumin reductase CurA